MITASTTSTSTEELQTFVNIELSHSDAIDAFYEACTCSDKQSAELLFEHAKITCPGSFVNSDVGLFRIRDG